MFKVIHPEEKCGICECYKVRIREMTNVIGAMFLFCILELLVIAFLLGRCFL